MSYTTQNLIAGEEVVYQTGLHPVVMLVPTLGGGFFFLMGLASLIAGAKGLGLITGGFGALVILLTVLSWKATEMAITNKRVIIKTGLLRRRSIDLLLSKVESVIVDQGIFDRILGKGVVIVRGTGGVNEPFKGVRAPMEFRRQVQQASA